MGEYVCFQGIEIKVGTCESFYDMRHSDINRVTGFPIENVVGIRFRLPWPDEDHLSPGEYGDFRGLRLFKHQGEGRYIDYSPDGLASASPGWIQFTHASGLLFSVPCHHGHKLPDLGRDVIVHWNGKSHSLELIAVKVLEHGQLAPIVWCRHCKNMWQSDWDEVMPWVKDPAMRQRLSLYANAEVSDTV